MKTSFFMALQLCERACSYSLFFKSAVYVEKLSTKFEKMPSRKKREREKIA
jgi:hypothetical protein